jgi:hypothetical protein
MTTPLPHPHCLTVACPKCGAKPQENCQDKDGREPNRCHAARVRVARGEA